MNFQLLRLFAIKCFQICINCIEKARSLNVRSHCLRKVPIVVNKEKKSKLRSRDFGFEQFFFFNCYYDSLCAKLYKFRRSDCTTINFILMLNMVIEIFTSAKCLEERGPPQIVCYGVRVRDCVSEWNKKMNLRNW